MTTTQAKVYIGLADCHGIEVMLDKSKIDANIIMAMAIRAQANRQRMATVFEVELSPVNVVAMDLVEKLLDEGKYETALRALKQVPEVRLEQCMREHWDLIPNPKLDPWA